MRHPSLRQSKSYAHWAFLISLGIAFAFFLPFIIYDNGYFLYYGDFNVQQIPFNQMTHDAIRAGNIGWNWYTDLGVNLIGSYSFYNLGSPFFWLTLPFPSAWVPYMIGPLLILKIGCCGLTSYLFISRYVKNQWYAVLGAVLYAISGFSCSMGWTSFWRRDAEVCLQYRYSSACLPTTISLWAWWCSRLSISSCAC